MKIIVGYCDCGAEITVEVNSPEFKEGKHSIPCPQCQLLFKYEIGRGAVIPSKEGG